MQKVNGYKGFVGYGVRELTLDESLLYCSMNNIGKDGSYTSYSEGSYSETSYNSENNVFNEESTDQDDQSVNSLNSNSQTQIASQNTNQGVKLTELQTIMSTSAKFFR